MRYVATLVMGLSLFAAASGAHAMVGAPIPLPATGSSITRVEYFCSPGYEPSYGGRCIATASRDEIELFVEEPVEAAPRVYRHHRHHGLHERY